VPYLGGEIRLGPDQRAKPTDDPQAFRCGDLRVRLLESNFAGVTVEGARPGYAQSSTRHTALLLRTAGETFTARPGEPLRYAAYIGPEGSASVTDFVRLEAPGVWGLTAQLAGQPFAVAFNPGEAARPLRLAWPGATATVSLPQARPAESRVDDGRIDLTLAPRSLALVQP